MSIPLEADSHQTISSSNTPELSGQTQQNQDNQTDTPKLTPLQQRKRNALALAELIYKIYNDKCPIESKSSVGKENENV